MSPGDRARANTRFAPTILPFHQLPRSLNVLLKELQPPRVIAGGRIAVADARLGAQGLDAGKFFSHEGRGGNKDSATGKPSNASAISTWLAKASNGKPQRGQAMLASAQPITPWAGQAITGGNAEG